MSQDSAKSRAAIKRLTIAIKALYPTLKRIPNPLPRPGSPANQIPGSVTATQADNLRAEFGAVDARRLDKSVVRYFATISEDRR